LSYVFAQEGLAASTWIVLCLGPSQVSADAFGLLLGASLQVGQPRGGARQPGQAVLGSLGRCEASSFSTLLQDCLRAIQMGMAILNSCLQKKTFLPVRKKRTRRGR